MKVKMVLRFNFNSSETGIVDTNYVHGQFKKGWKLKIERENKRIIWGLG